MKGLYTENVKQPGTDGMRLCVSPRSNIRMSDLGDICESNLLKSDFVQKR